MKQFTKEELINATINATRKTHVYTNLGMNKPNGNMIKQVQKQYDHHQLDLNEMLYWNMYTVKTCPVCDEEFVVSQKVEQARPKMTCSYACSNTHFRSGINNGSHQKSLNGGLNSSSHYRTICFHHHEKKCIICGEDKIVAVHHYDEDHYNNAAENLIPMCPTHHQYMHSSYKDLIQKQVDDYVKTWSNT